MMEIILDKAKSEWNKRCVAIIVHYSLFIIHYSFFIIHYSLCIVHYALCIKK